MEQLNKTVPIIGNTPEIISRSDRLHIYKIASKLGIECPQTTAVKDEQEALLFINKKAGGRNHLRVT